ncbi:MAG: M48 family metalloprotease [Planctomycetota bacterium]
MTLSLSFCLGLFLGLLAGDVFEWLPGESQAEHVVAGSVFLLTPWLWLWIARASVRWAGGVARVGSALTRTSALAVPTGMFGLVGVGGYLDHVHRIADGSNTTWAMMFLAPVLWLEWSLGAARKSLGRTLMGDSTGEQEPTLASAWRMNLMTSATLLSFSVAVDALESSPTLSAFLLTTTIGSTVGLLVLVGLAAWLLPILFRWILPASRTLPSHLSEGIHEIARRLGFQPRNVLSLDTGFRSVNAAMIGPFRWPRYLVLTDGLLACLDLPALRAVVAHEVGHARAGHPGWITLAIVVVPILVYRPIANLRLDAIEPHWLILIGAALAIVILIAVRMLMHRFEYEADDQSAEALGAPSCVQALARIGEIFPGSRFRSSFRHPSEHDRIRALLDHHQNPAQRMRFVRRGRHLRAAIAIAIIPLLAWSTLVHAASYPNDRAKMALARSEYAAALHWLDREASHEILDQRQHLELRDQATLALELATNTGDPSAPYASIAELAWARALEVVKASGPGSAHAAFKLASFGDGNRDCRLSAVLWAKAALDGDQAFQTRVGRHLISLADTPEALRAIVQSSLSDVR